ncbi:MAG TPA: helix-turn-helix transcriptional regulator [Microvirga sp.]|jgi:transcriptional regulator with XRE-family HTH domain|nr:helix-turn-helix transcriptional regulator [Microvirga sp.]
MATRVEIKVSKKSASAVDQHVGSRVRLRRTSIGMSQEKLGEALGITFQQVQKYEKGSNRIGASRLHHIASVLGVDVEFFFQGIPKSEAEKDSTRISVAEFHSLAESDRLVQTFARLPDDARRKVVDLVELLAAGIETQASTQAGAPASGPDAQGRRKSP